MDGDRLARIEKRLDVIEERLTVERQVAAAPSPPIPVAVHSPLAPLARTMPLPGQMLPGPAQPQPVVTPPPPSAQPSQPVASEPLELHIGSYWFSRAGIVLLVIGVAFFLIYALQYFGPVGRISLGIVTSVLLIGLGWLLNRSVPSYSRGLVAGGGALLYFTAYASYFFPVSRILPPTEGGQLVALLWMALVALGLLWASYRTHNPAWIALAFGLGYLTVNLGSISVFSLASLFVLTLLLVTAKQRARRMEFLLGGMILTYATHARWLTLPLVTTNHQLPTFWLASFLLGGYFFLYSLPLLLQDEPSDSQKRKDLLTETSFGVAANGLLFLGLFGWQFGVFLPVVHPWGVLLLVVGAIHFGYAALAALYCPQAPYRRVWLAFALLSLIIAVPVLYDGVTVDGWWLVLFVLLGYLYELRPTGFMRTFVLGLGTLVFLHSLALFGDPTPLIAGTSIHAGLIFTPIYALSLLLLSFHLRRRAVLQPGAIHKLELGYLSILALVPLLLLGADELTTASWALVAAPVSLFFVLIGAAAHDRVVRIGGYILALLATLFFVSLNLFGNPDTTTHILPGLMTITVLAILSLWLRFAPPTQDEELVSQFFSGLAVFALWAYLSHDLAANYLSLGWGVLACLLLLLGIFGRDRAVRWGGILIFGLTIGKLFLIDSSVLEPLFRILSFIGLGLILLGLSYTYSRYREQIKRYL